MYNLFRVASFIQHNDFMIHYYYYSLLHVAIVRSLLSHIILQRNTSLYIHLPVEGYLHCFQILIIILKDSLTFEYRFLCVNKFTTLKYYLTWLYIYKGRFIFIRNEQTVSQSSPPTSNIWISIYSASSSFFFLLPF